MFNEKRSKIDLKDGTSHEESTNTETTSSTTIFSDAISTDTVSMNDPTPSDVSCETVSCVLACTHTSTNFKRSIVETADPEVDTYMYNDSLSGGNTMVNKGMQFPLDVAQEISREHWYSSSKVKETREQS